MSDKTTYGEAECSQQESPLLERLSIQNRRGGVSIDSLLELVFTAGEVYLQIHLCSQQEVYLQIHLCSQQESSLLEKLSVHKSR